MAFFESRPDAILDYMGRRFKNYVKEWRQKRELTQKELVARLIELAGDQQPDDPALRVPTTEASLSRIENGKQNFPMSTLHALAEALNVEEPGWLLDRNPLKEGTVVWLDDYRLNPDQARQARAVLDVMFGRATEQ